jgi:hypothetical protein
MSVAAGAKQASRSPWVGRLARLGLVAKGVSFGIVGVLAILVAVGEGGKTTDRQGALRTVGQHPLGRVLLVLLAAGFAAYALWRFAEALFDREAEGSGPKGIAKRLSFLGRGAIYAALFLSTMSILLGDGGGGSGQQEDRATAGVLGWPGGRWLVLAVGVAVAGVGLFNGYRAVSRSFCDKLRTDEMNETARRLATWIGTVGLLARMAVFGVAGWFLIKAAVEYRPRETVGLDGALAKLAGRPYGHWLLGAVAAGLFAYGLYSLVEARYRKV